MRLNRQPRGSSERKEEAKLLRTGFFTRMDRIMKRAAMIKKPTNSIWKIVASAPFRIEKPSVPEMTARAMKEMEKCFTS